jgi:hypothetical protein
MDGAAGEHLGGLGRLYMVPSGASRVTRAVALSDRCRELMDGALPWSYAALGAVLLASAWIGRATSAERARCRALSHDDERALVRRPGRGAGTWALSATLLALTWWMVGHTEPFYLEHTSAVPPLPSSALAMPLSIVTPDLTPQDPPPNAALITIGKGHLALDGEKQDVAQLLAALEVLRDDWDRGSSARLRARSAHGKLGGRAARGAKRRLFSRVLRIRKAHDHSPACFRRV